MTKFHAQATDNYFRVGRREFFFSSKDIVSAHRAWDAAVACAMAQPPPPGPVAAYRPFGLEGPWTATAEVIGFMPAGARPEGDVVDDEVAQQWIERADLRKELWATGAWHVDHMGYPLMGG